MSIQNLFHKETKMSTTKVTPQKVIAVLKKAGLSIRTQTSRFGSGYDVRGVYADYPLIEIDYNHSSHNRAGSHTQSKLEKLTSAASVLLEAGIEVLMAPKIIEGAKFDSEKSNRYDEYKIYVRKDPTRSNRQDGIIWDVDLITAYFADQIEKELAKTTEETGRAEAKRIEAAKAQAERLARVDLLNPTIGIDHNYLEGLFTTHVTLLDGRLAVLTVAYVPKQEYDWDAMRDGAVEATYNCFEVELTYIAPDAYNHTRWERGTSNFTTGKGENVNSAIRYWISRQ